jgi:hypothetical protein
MNTCQLHHDASLIALLLIQLLINGILQIWNLAITIVASFSVERAGRRPLFIVSTIGMVIFFTLQTICSAEFAIHGTQGAAHAVIAFIFLYYASYEYASGIFLWRDAYPMIAASRIPRSSSPTRSRFCRSHFARRVSIFSILPFLSPLFSTNM